MAGRTAGASSTSRRKRSRPSPRSERASSTSASPGSPTLGASDVRALAARHGIRPSKTFGQNFLVDPNLARAIAIDAGAAPGVRVVEVGAGLGSLTIALADAGADVLALEFDRRLLPALTDAIAASANVRVLAEDALRIDWRAALEGDDWRMASNLPYNVAVPVLLRMLEEAPHVSSYVVMVQREVADRLTASPGSPAYGAVSVKVRYLARGTTLRRVPPDVFWPRPKVDSTVLRFTPAAARVDVARGPLFRVIDAAFGERRKTMSNAMRRLGLGRADAERVLELSRVRAPDRPERLDLEAFARLTRALIREGLVEAA